MSTRKIIFGAHNHKSYRESGYHGIGR